MEPTIQPPAPAPRARAVNVAGGELPAQVSIEGSIVELPYSNEQGWHVMLLRTAEGRLVRATGVMLRPIVGSNVVLRGHYTDAQQKQFVIAGAQACSAQPPAALIAHLVQTLGIEPSMAARVVGQFGETTLAVLDEHPERLAEVPGLADAAALARRWKRAAASTEAHRELSEQGIPGGLIERVAQHLGADPRTALERNPYLPALLFDDLPFERIDQAHRRRGIEEHGAPRYSAGIVAALRRRALGGHTYIERAAVPSLLARELGLKHLPDAAPIDAGMALAVEAGVLTVAGGRLQLAVHARNEVALVDRLAALTRGASTLAPPPPARLQALAAKLYGETLEEGEAVRLHHLLLQKFACVHGPFASHHLRLPAFLAEALHLTQNPVMIVCPNEPTRARLAAAARLPLGAVHTIDSFLGRATPGTSVYHLEHRRALDALLLVEADRLTLADWRQVLDALPDSATVIALGDLARLPPTGAGQPFADLIATRWAPTVTLPAGSYFVERTTRPLLVQLQLLLKGRPPQPVDPADPSAPLLYFPLKAQEAANLEETLTVLGHELLPALLPGFDAVNDLLVISPNRKALPRVPSLPQLNALLAEIFRPGVERVMLPRTHGESYGLGDPVFVRRPNAALGLPFGARGVVVHNDRDAQELTVRLAGSGDVRVPYAQGSCLTLGYATTAYQVSGFQPRCVVAVLLAGHDRMLNLPLLVTALSSARERAIVLAEPAALERAVATGSAALREVMLPELLKALPASAGGGSHQGA